jgi:hypothetical protein
MSIIEATRGHIIVQVGDKSVTVWGEMLAKSPGMPDYQIYGDSVRHWNEPNGGIQISPEEKTAITQEVCDYLKQLGRIPIVLE